MHIGVWRAILILETRTMLTAINFKFPLVATHENIKVPH